MVLISTPDILKVKLTNLYRLNWRLHTKLNIVPSIVEYCFNVRDVGLHPGNIHEMLVHLRGLSVGSYINDYHNIILPCPVESFVTIFFFRIQLIVNEIISFR